MTSQHGGDWWYMDGMDLWDNACDILWRAGREKDNGEGIVSQLWAIREGLA